MLPKGFCDEALVVGGGACEGVDGWDLRAYTVWGCKRFDLGFGVKMGWLNGPGSTCLGVILN